MQIALLTPNFQRAMALVKDAVAKKSTLPLVVCVRLQATQNSLLVTGTDLEVTVQVTIGAAVTEPGEVAIVAETLSQLLSKVSGDKLEMTSADGKTATLKLADTNFNLKCLPAGEFPMAIISGTDEGLSLNAQQLAMGLNTVIDSVGDDDSKPALKAVQISFKKGKIILAALDGYHLATAGLPVSVPEAWVGKQVLVPAKGLKLLLKAIGEAETVVIGLPDENRVQFTLPNIVLISQLVEASYPPWQNIVPKETKTVFTLETASLLKACETAAIFDPVGTFRFTSGSPGQVTLTAIDTEHEKGDSRLILTGTGEGPELKIMVALAYLIKALKGLKSLGVPNVRLRMTEATTAILIEPVGLAADKPNAAFVAMPRNPTTTSASKATVPQAARAAPPPPPTPEPEVAEVQDAFAEVLEPV